MKKQPQITQQTRENLKQAFWALYRKKRIESITVAEVTALAGYHRGTFYEYYKSTYEILEELESAVLKKCQELVDRIMNSTAESDLSEYLQVIFGIVDDYADYTAVILGEHGDPGFTSRIKDIIRPIFQLMVPESCGNPAEKELLTEFYLSGILSAAILWNRERKISSDEFLTLLIGFLFSERGPFPTGSVSIM